MYWKKLKITVDIFFRLSHRTSEVDSETPCIIRTKLILYFCPTIVNVLLSLSRWLLRFQPSLLYPKQEKEEKE